MCVCDVSVVCLCVCVFVCVCLWLFVVCSACLAQLVERKTLNLVVVGSSPTVGTAFAFVLFCFCFCFCVCCSLLQSSKCLKSLAVFACCCSCRSLSAGVSVACLRTGLGVSHSATLPSCVCPLTRSLSPRSQSSHVLLPALATGFLSILLVLLAPLTATPAFPSSW